MLVPRQRHQPGTPTTIRAAAASEKADRANIAAFELCWSEVIHIGPLVRRFCLTLAG